MKDETALKAIALPCVAAMYAIYTLAHPGTDGYAFGSMMGLLGLLAGIKVGEVMVRPDR